MLRVVGSTSQSVPSQLAGTVGAAVGDGAGVVVGDGVGVGGAVVVGVGAGVVVVGDGAGGDDVGLGRGDGVGESVGDVIGVGEVGDGPAEPVHEIRETARRPPMTAATARPFVTPTSPIVARRAVRWKTVRVSLR